MIIRARTLRSAFAGFRFPPEVITVAVRWHLRYGLSYREVEDLLAEWLGVRAHPMNWRTAGSPKTG